MVAAKSVIVAKCERWAIITYDSLSLADIRIIATAEKNGAVVAVATTATVFPERSESGWHDWERNERLPPKAATMGKTTAGSFPHGITRASSERYSGFRGRPGEERA
jgi:hypothetical protein